MHGQTRPYIAAGSALAVASAIAIVPMAPRPLGIPIVSEVVRLVDAGSLLNVPFNLLQQFINIPGTELGAINQFGNANLFGGTIFTASATNIFGEDPGDPGRFMSVVDMLAPFKALSGQGLGELQGLGDTPDPLAINTAAVAAGNLGLSQQVALTLDAELPASASSAADYSAPLAPVSEITGFSGIDNTIQQLAILSGQQQFPLLNDFFQVNILTQLMSANGYTFPTVVNPSAGVGLGQGFDPVTGITSEGVHGVPSDPVFGFLGTHPLLGDQGFGTVTTPDGMVQALNVAGNPVNLEPWSNLDFKLNLAAPVQNFFTSLQAPIDPTAFNIPTFDDLVRPLQTFAAGAVVFLDPFVPGSPVCNPTCGIADLVAQNALVKNIGDLLPGNTSINHYFDLVNNNMANTATPAQIAFANEFLTGQQSMFDIGNPPADMVPLNGMFAPYTPDPFPVSPLITQLTQFAQASGIQNFAAQQAALNGFMPAFSDATKFLTPSGAIVDSAGTVIPAAAADSATAGSTAAMSTSLADLFPASTAAGSAADLSAMTAEMNNLFAELINPAGASTVFTDLINPADWASIF